MYRESDTLELKRELTKDIKREIIAFANTHGGTIYVGISDDGKILGLKNATKDLEALTGMINEGIKPDLITHTKIDIEKKGNKDIISIKIQSGPNKPYYLSEKGLKPSGVYLRHGSSSIQASDEIIKQMIFINDTLRFEEIESKQQNLTFDYLIKKFKDKNLEIDNKCRLLNLRNEHNKYTNLALLFSDQCPFTIKCAIYNGTSKTIFLDRKEFTGSLLKQVDDIFEYFDLFNKIKGEIVGLTRIDTKDYPDYALRESLLNAVIHRSYYFDSSILVSLFDDRFEIVSIGGLINSISIKDIYNGVSASRNPNISNIFYRLEYVESYGTGINRIMESYKPYKLTPVFRITENSFAVSLPNINYEKKELTPSLDVSQLTNQEQTIITYLKEHDEINRETIEELFNVSKTRAYNIIDRMLKYGWIIKKDVGRNTTYYLRNDKK